LQKMESCQDLLAQKNVGQNCIDSNAFAIDLRIDSITCLFSQVGHEWRVVCERRPVFAVTCAVRLTLDSSPRR
jgi:hypothetical protein